MQYLKNTIGILLKSSLPMLYIYRAILRQFPCSSDAIFMLCFSNSLAIAMQFYSIFHNAEVIWFHIKQLQDWRLSYESYKFNWFQILLKWKSALKISNKLPNNQNMQMYGDECSSAKEQIFPFMEGTSCTVMIVFALL